MEEVTNAKRAARGRLLAHLYNAMTRTDPRDEIDADELAGDMIADILHYVESDGAEGEASADRAHRMGWAHWSDERAEELADVMEGGG